MNVFISCPALTSAENNAQCVRLRWRRAFFFFSLRILKLRIKRTQTYPLTMICDVFFCCGKLDIFPTQWETAFYHLLSYTWRSVGILFHWFFFFLVGSFFFAEWLHTRDVELLSPCVCVCVSGRRQDTVDLHPDRRLLYLFKFAHFGCCHTVAIVI